jgi:hypothetical protein
MDSSISAKGEIWFLRVCHHISNALYPQLLGVIAQNLAATATLPLGFVHPTGDAGHEAYLFLFLRARSLLLNGPCPMYIAIAKIKSRLD